MPLQLASKQTVGIQTVIISSVSQSAKRRRSRTKRTFSDAEYPEVTANMVGPSTTPSKSKGKQPIVSSDEPDTEPEGVYRHTRTRTGVIAPVDYSALTRGIEVSESHSVIAESQASNSSVEKEDFTYMASNPEEMVRRFEQQAQARGNNSIWFAPNKNLSTPSSRYFHNETRSS